MTATDPEARETMRGQIESALSEHDSGIPYYDEFRAHLADVLLGLWDLGDGS